MEHDDFLTYLFTFSRLSPTTQKIYMSWITSCCQYYGKRHLLDILPQELDNFRLYLLRDRHFSPSSDTIVYNAFRHTYVVLLVQVDVVSSSRYTSLFLTAPRQPYKLPRFVVEDMMQIFLQVLPHTAAGNIIRMMYTSSKSFTDITTGTLKWKCSRQYAARVCAQTARKVGIPHGFGLSGVRGVGIIHRIQNRENDIELKQILNDSGMSTAQFARYVQVAG